MLSGYESWQYAESLAEFGKPCPLPRCGGWVLERPVGRDRDAMGCYPLFACRDWGRLPDDLEAAGEQWLALVLVTDPWGDYDRPLLASCFDRVVEYKSHFIADLGHPMERFVSPHHRRCARQALGAVTVERCAEPLAYLGDWLALYAALSERHQIRGIARFSEVSFRRQFQVPGFVAFRAAQKGETVSMGLWYVQGDRAYYHLGASSARGYRLRASFALFWTAMERFAVEGVRWLHLGASVAPNDGLVQFKRGWATGTRTAYLCGRIFDREGYGAVARSYPETDYFPAYRRGEYG